MTLSIITPTNLNRVHLYKTIEGAQSVMAEGDRHIIIVDGPAIPRMLPDHPNLFYTTHQHKHSIVGNAQRDHGIQNYATGDMIVFLDDDDMPDKAAYDVLHALEPDKFGCHMFSMKYKNGGTKAPNKKIPGARVGGPQLVVPNNGLLPKWMDHNAYEADWWFMKACSERFHITEHPEIICHVGGLNE
jgi:hypothetical protein